MFQLIENPYLPRLRDPPSLLDDLLAHIANYAALKFHQNLGRSGLNGPLVDFIRNDPLVFIFLNLSDVIRLQRFRQTDRTASALRGNQGERSQSLMH